MTKEQTINEGEAQGIIYYYLKSKGVEITKADINRVMDAQIELGRQGLITGKGIKFQKLGSLVIKTAIATKKTVPVKNADGTFSHRVVDVPARKYVKFEASEGLLDDMNAAEFQLQ